MSQTFDTLTKLREDTDSSYKTFQKTEIWKAIFDHLIDTDNCILVEFPKYSEVCCFSGTGYGIHVKSILPIRMLNNAYLFENFIRCSFSVTIYPDEYTNSEETIDYTLDIPDTLVSEFNRDAFNTWALQVKKLRDDKLYEEEIHTLKRLMNKFPQIVKESLQLS